MRLPREGGSLSPHLARRNQELLRRQSPNGLSSKTAGIIIFAVVLGFFLCGGLVFYFTLRFIRTRHSNPKYIPGSWLKAKWRAWTPSSEKKRYSSTLQNRRSIQMAGAAGLNGGLAQTDADADAAVDRHTSVRSTITLPAYSAEAHATERILGREGERAGVDTVIEFPETQDEEERRRDAEMENIYQIRVSRREERETREERRRLRREARARGDNVTLAALRLQEQNNSDAASTTPSAALIQDHQTRERGRRVSTVDYLDLGVARHDGSRVRANSNDSDRPLLDAAAAVGVDGRARSTSNTTLRPHFRNASPSSLRRFVTHDYSDDEAESDFEVVHGGTPGRSRTSSRSGLASSHGVGLVVEVPPFEPPRYDNLSPVGAVGLRAPERVARRDDLGDAPPYESPTVSGAPRLPAFAPLPSIEVTPSGWSPVVGSNGWS